MRTQPKPKQLTHLFIDENLVKSIDNFRFKHRFENRSETVRWLVRYALDAKAVPPPPEERLE
jgi:metal-responsive CopG/Arc/MetJ family transcriptional regulator